MSVNFKVHSLLSLVLFMQLVSTNGYSFNKKIDKYFEDGVISEEHWNGIHEYMKKHGNIMSIYELQSIESINLDILKTIARLSRDDQHIEIFAQPYAHRHRGLCGDQRMSGLFQLDDPVRIDGGRIAPHFHGQIGFCEDVVQFGQNVVVADQLLGMGGSLIAQLRQDRFDLL